jgi:CRP-like cAMP-binding protein
MYNKLLEIKGITKQYDRNTIICNEGDECNNIYLLLEGEANIYTYSYEENLYLIRTIKEKETFASQLVFATNNKFLGNIIASKKCIVKIINKDIFLNACMIDKDLLNRYLNFASNNFLKLQNRLKTLSQKSIREKILFYLEQKSEHKNTNKIYIQSKKLLAEYLNIPRPSLSRELIKLQEENILSFDRHYIILHK